MKKGIILTFILACTMPFVAACADILPTSGISLPGFSSTNAESCASSNKTSSSSSKKNSSSSKKDSSSTTSNDSSIAGSSSQSSISGSSSDSSSSSSSGSSNASSSSSSSASSSSSVNSSSSSASLPAGTYRIDYKIRTVYGQIKAVPEDMMLETGSYPTTYTVGVRQRVSALGQKEYPYYTMVFVGWYLDELCTQPFDGIVGGGDRGEMTLYAKVKNVSKQTSDDNSGWTSAG